MPTLPASSLQALLDSAPLSPSLRALARQGDLRRYRKGTRLIEAGDRGATLYIVLAGQLRAYAVHPDNGREFTHGLYGPGEYVGEMGLDGGPRAAHVDAVAATVCSVVTRPTLLAHLSADPDFAFELLAKLIRRARSATLSARQIALNDVHGRVKAYLDAQAVSSPDGVRRIARRPSHRELGQLLGCTHEMITRVLKNLVQSGVLVNDGPGWRLLQPVPGHW